MVTEATVGIISVIITVITSVALLAYWLGRKFAEIEGRFAQAGGSLSRIEGALRAMAAATVEAHKIIVEFLSLKGLLERREAEYLERRVEGVFRIQAVPASNPLSEEEMSFLKNFFSKRLEEVTVEEADRAYELGKRLFVEDFDERGFLAAMAATYVRGYLVSEQVRKEKESAERKA